MRLRSATVITGIVLTSVMAACSDSTDEPDWSAVCKDAVTDVRVDDDECEDDPSGSRVVWIYYPHSYSAPAVGSKVTGGSTVRPASGTIGSVPSSGGFGGFKGSSGT